MMEQIFTAAAPVRTIHVAVITGASSGLGRELALQLAADPRIDEFWLCARRSERLEELAARLAKPCRILAGDVSDPVWIENLKARLAVDKVRIHILVNSAGYGKLGSVEALGEELNGNMVDVNCAALVRISSVCLPYMQDGGRILNIASVAAFLPQMDFAVYAATKAFVLNYSRALHRELKARRITVTTVCPNPMATEFFDVAGESPKVAAFKKLGVEPVEGVAAKALRRSDQGKELSIYGAPAHAIRILAKILPHNFILWAEGRLGM